MTRFAIASFFSVFLIGQARSLAAEGDGASRAPGATSVLAGFVQHAEGETAIGGEAVVPAAGQLFEIGEAKRLQTGDGRAELTLGVGGVFRVGPFSEVEMVEAGIAAAVLRLHRGEIVLDISQLIDDRPSSVHVGDAVVRFEKPGLYCLATSAETSVSLTVVRGRATVTTDGVVAVAGKKESVHVGPDAKPSFSKAPAANDQPLLVWSKQRRKVLERQRRREGADAFANPTLDRELRRMRTNRPTGTVVTGP